MSLWPDKHSSYWIMWHKKEMCLFPGVTCQLTVSRGRGKREEGEQQLWEADRAVLASNSCVPQGWLERNPAAFPPSHPNLTSHCITDQAKRYMETSWRGANPANMWNAGAAETVWVMILPNVRLHKSSTRLCLLWVRSYGEKSWPYHNSCEFYEKF